jgi:hypothetical protein
MGSQLDAWASSNTGSDISGIARLLIASAVFL